MPLRTFTGMSRRDIARDLAGGGVAADQRPSPGGARVTFHSGRFFGPQRGAQISLGPGRLVLVSAGVAVRTEDVVLLGEDDDGDVELVTRTGASLVLDPKHFRGTAGPWQRFVAAMPPGVERSKRGAAALTSGAVAG
ncbi:hypothetical protein J1G42_11260 [Cellulomonas sp. zg-ZUI222]|uniref:Uncharacterized protein n=1 Tax=Cellulomonas wangleii TaxID=2816956 RepID=A0ABX8DBT1_9CELL|nr:hypothetical protein [Cellulomonas wangleii]MBO0921404.1 hypothetical protein [Cellulomonas wangleii]MBO0925821.1 hypothetical protein [Cellulomonas wangleii]QVI63662.1 hypothetical protein KG103_07415 [Cellulomonas wangleii]